MRLPRLLTCFLAVSALVIGTVVPATAANASVSASGSSTSRMMSDPASSGIAKTSLAGFNAGNIISDAVFTNKSTMTEAQIQAFFNSKVARCQGGRDENGEPIVCIKDFTMNTVTRPADAYCSGYSGAANESAARIIYRVSQACNINPQVLIVMLQKEQSLVTHTWPSAWRYRIALGQGCPDNAPCDPNYIGFFHQIYGAARQMQIYMEGKWFQWYAPGKTWNILYNPDPKLGCGSSPVYIANKATSALYYYTPYQPNAAALRAGHGDGDRCSAYGNRNFYNYFTDWFGSTQSSANNPFGNIELIEALPGEFRVSGWAADRDTRDPIGVHVYVGGVGTAITADRPRADVGNAYPDLGPNHGFDARVAATGAGPVDICVYGINVGSGGNVLFLCKTIQAKSGPPQGLLDSVTVVDGGVQVEGWAVDPDTVDPVSVHIYVGAVGTAIVADKKRPDLVPHFPGYGENHGFSAKINASPGRQDVCAYAINVGAGGTVLLRCETVVVPGAVDLGRPPIGGFEGVSVDGTVATASGWALDPDTTAPIGVHLYVGAVGKAYTADKDRSDVGAAYPGYGNKHGFVEKLTVPVGKTDICAYAINNGAGGHTFLGCRTVTVAAPAGPDLGRAPLGVFEGVAVESGGATVSGWTIDPDVIDPISVHIYVDSTSAAYTANKPRSDVGAAYPAYGPNHAFVEKIAMSPGTHQVCVYAINNGAGGHNFLGCKSVTIPAPPTADPGRAPFGGFEGVSAYTGGAEVSGWAIDPDTADPISIHIYVDNSSAAYKADKVRNDVGAAYPASGPKHGFAERIAMSPGTHQVCVYAINNGAGGHTFLGCRSVNVPAPAGPDPGRAPFGNLEGVTGEVGAATVSGWAIDPDTSEPISVHIYVGAIGTAYMADKTRNDVGAAYPASGSKHGFGERIPMAAGKQTVCAYAINNGAGGHAFLGCRDVVVG
ncbi:hypothetical protein KY497_09360 [Microbacterium sp. PAMC22086]|nr:hypothetical protein KY497_09360 [Microbacterium sp. PAMC22086]